VRELREQRGLTRKTLARAAAVSERYLGQLESGEGNASILLLRHVAEALAVTLSELLVDVQAASTRSGRIALIGLRGAGKTTLGVMLAQDLQTPFVELDREIEQESGLPLGEIFTLYGQPGYRRLERRCLERALQKHARAVIAVGGGVVSEEDTFSLLLSQCHVIWLKARPEEHMARVLAQGDLRPMAGHAEAMEDLRRILEARQPWYRKAEAVLDTSGQTQEESFAALRTLVRQSLLQEDTHGSSR
jgi:XRE family aerobic/anaerobic benzoate catabolism transcriptional regulator